jgi:hypothetical protein
MGDKHLNKCKECTKQDTKKNRLEKIEHYRSYDRMRASQPHRVAKRLQVFNEYKAKFPNRVKATNMVNNAVRDGKLKKWPCQVCGNPKSVAHHADYDNPLGVVWLCQAHHKQAHALADELEKEAA